LTDKGESFPEIGKIRKGMKIKKNKPDGSTIEMPTDLEYFRVVFHKGEDDSRSRFVNYYKEQPDEIDVLLPLDAEDVWYAWIEAFSRGRMIAQSDGEYFRYMRDQNLNVVVRNWLDEDQKKVPYTGERGDEQVVNGIKMKPRGLLKVVVPQLERFAYLTLITHSYEDIDNLSQQLKSIYRMSNIMGGVPLVLRRKPRMKTVPGGNGRTFRKEMWMVSIEAKEEWVRIKMLADRKKAFEELGLGKIQSGFQLAGGGEVLEGVFKDV
jgi:hypothetical protein